jgi:hypothetical protein
MSHHWKFNVSWCHTCLTCHHPIDIIITITSSNRELDSLFWKRYINFIKLRPSNMSLSGKMYKIINLKAYRLCKSCYNTKAHKVNHVNIMNREIYGKRIHPRSESLNSDQIYDWFESLNRYVHRPDADDYVVQAPTLES